MRIIVYPLKVTLDKWIGEIEPDDVKFGLTPTVLDLLKINVADNKSLPKRLFCYGYLNEARSNINGDYEIAFSDTLTLKNPINDKQVIVKRKNYDLQFVRNSLELVINKTFKVNPEENF